jgi:FkbM family methyltransferase
LFRGSLREKESGKVTFAKFLAIKFIDIYPYVFARKVFYPLNKFIFYCSLRGLGVLNYRNFFISGETSFIKRVFKYDETPFIIDVGAHYGDYSKEILHWVPQSKIVCFEPNPVTFKKLEAHLRGVDNICLLNLGLSEKSEDITLYDYDSAVGSAHASIYKGVLTDIHHSPCNIEHKVSVLSLDEYLLSAGISSVDLLKIDVEGNELSVLRGASRALTHRCIKFIHFEFNEMNVVSRSFFKDFWSLLRDYDIYRLLPSDMVKIEYSPLECEIFAYQNIVAILKPHPVILP